MRGLGGKIESFIFANLLVTTLLSVLAYGTVEPWSLALFELNALLLGVLMATQFVVDADASWRGLRVYLTNHRLRLGREKIGVDGVLRHQFGDKRLLPGAAQVIRTSKFH